MILTAAGLGPPLPRAMPCSGVSLIPQFPSLGLPQLTPSLPFPRFQPVHLAQVSFVIPAFNSNFTLDLELNQ